jgi:hypothetical protein
MDSNVNILNELKEANSTLLINMDRKNCYFVPEGYFNGLAENILVQVFIESLPPAHPYSIPAGYFENFPEILLDKLGISNRYSTSIYSEQMPYAVPDGYFNGLAEDILQKIKVQSTTNVQKELEEIAPLLSKIPKTNVYSVPAGYFNQLNPLPVQETVQPAAKIIPIGNRTRKWFNYAAAACIAIVLLGGGFLFFHKTPDVKTLPTASVDVQKSISELSDTDLANYLKEDNNTAIYTSPVSDDQQNDLDIKTLLENTSDEEIEQYLINNTDPAETHKGI